MEAHKVICIQAGHPRRVANYAPGLCEIGDGFVEYIRCKRGPDGYLEDVNSALTKWAFQG